MVRRKTEEELRIFTQNIAYLRKLHRLSKREMAARLHITTKTLTTLENGQIPHRLSIKIYFHIQNQFHIHPKDIFKPLS